MSSLSNKSSNSDNASPKKFLTVREVAARQGVRPKTVYKWVATSPYEADGIPFVKFTARCLRFPLADLEAWENRRRGDSRKS